MRAGEQDERKADVSGYHAQYGQSAVLAKELPIDCEVIIVESNSTDGTREIVQRYETAPGVRVVYEDSPRGKGHAVRTGLQHVTGTIVPDPGLRLRVRHR